MLTAAVVVAFSSALALLATALTGFGGLLGIMIPLWFLVSAPVCRSPTHRR